MFYYKTFHLFIFSLINWMKLALSRSDSSSYLLMNDFTFCQLENLKSNMYIVNMNKMLKNKFPNKF